MSYLYDLDSFCSSEANRGRGKFQGQAMRHACNVVPMVAAMTSDLHERLREARILAGFESGAEAARALGMSYATYAGHENGTRGLKPDKARAIADKFKVSFEWLLTGRGVARPANAPAHAPAHAPATGRAANVTQFPGPRALQPEADHAPDARNLKMSADLATFSHASPAGSSPRYGGTVAANVWREESDVVFSDDTVPQIPFSADPKYRDCEQLVYRVQGDSMSAKVPDGAFVYAVPYWEARRALTTGDYVIVERRREELVERSMKRMVVMDDMVEFWPDSLDTVKWSKAIRVPISALESGEGGEDVQIIAYVTGAHVAF